MKDRLTILQGDCRETLATLPAESVQCCVTSPPYWGLRDYGTEPLHWPETSFVPMAGLPPIVIPAQSSALGLEADPWAFVGHMLLIFDQIHRVLRQDGTCWVNMGDSYVSCNGSAKNRGDGQPKLNGRGQPKGSNSDRSPAPWMAAGRSNPTAQPNRAPISGLKTKDLVGMPWRLALALQAAGWYLRSDIVWAKPNPMPESQKDRPTKSHEYIFLLAKSDRYYYDAAAIMEPVTGNAHARGSGVNPKARFPAGWAHTGTHKELKGRYRPRQNESFSSAVAQIVGERNKRTVWTVPTHPFKDAHFATFPPKLIRPCILAGTSAHGGCSDCGTPYKRLTEQGEPSLAYQQQCGGDATGAYRGTATKDFAGAKVQNASEVKARILAGMRIKKTVGWAKQCLCSTDSVSPCVVLDPFGGSGTVGEVAGELGLHTVLCELNAAYIPMIRRRTESPSLL